MAVLSLWQNRSWWPLLRDIIVDFRRLLPKQQDLFTSSYALDGPVNAPLIARGRVEIFKLAL